MGIINFCTLFDSNYIDRGIVLYKSLEAVEKDFVLYVIAFDDESIQVLNDLKYNQMIVIPYYEFEDDVLLEAKNNRSKREYLWTCSGYSIKYVINRYALDMCTYIDSDLYFYSTPRVLIEEFLDSNQDVGIIGHNYSNHYENKYWEEHSGKYCVEFNTFKNNCNGRKVLEWWINACLECCTEVGDGIHFGDQKYLDEFTERFDGIYEYANPGAGVAPWNVDEYRAGTISGTVIRNEVQTNLIFYHFHSLRIIDDEHINCCVFIRAGHHDKELIYNLYRPYATRLIDIRKKMKNQYRLFLGEPTKNQDGFTKVKTFFTEDPNLWMFVRKLYRYLRYRRNDILYMKD